MLARAQSQVNTHPESGMTRALYDCPTVPLTPAGSEVRLVVATHPAAGAAPAVGLERDGMVYELFVSTLASPAFTASDVLDLYLHRGSFETVLADEDHEQDSDRWYSHTSYGQEFAQILAQWVWNLRLELGQHLSPAELRSTEFARALEAEAAPQAAPGPAEASTPLGSYGPPRLRPSFVYAWLSRLCFHSPTRWNAALSCQPSLVSARAASRAGWVLAGLVCRPHRPLPLLSSAGPVSREQHHAQTPARECSAMAAERCSLRFLASKAISASRISSCSRPLERLAPLWHPARLAQENPEPKRPRGKLHRSRSCARLGAALVTRDPSSAGALASFLGEAARSECPSIRRSQAGHHAPRSACHLCPCLWL